MTTYVFREAPIQIRAAKKANPQAIGERLAAIAEKAGGRLSVDDALEDARDRRSPLHRHLEWDDSVAADNYRRDQIRHLVSLIRVVDADEAEPVRAFISVQDRGTAYRHIDEVRASADLQIAVLRQAERDLKAFENRYRELLEICDLVREARERVAARIAGKEGGAAQA